MAKGSFPELSTELKESKNILIMAGALCDEVDFDSKGLLDYVADIASKTGAPVAATGTTILGLKERNVARVKKMWAAELINYTRHPWQDSVSDSKPELLVLIGYNPAVAGRLISTVKGLKTIFLGNVYLKEATYSLPDSTSLKDWQKKLDQVVEAL